jgi:hypothetical protein
MKTRATLWAYFPLPFYLAFFLGGCAPLIGPYSPVAYENATNLKAETLAMMNKATEQYPKHSEEVGKLFVKLNQAYEYVKGVPSNSISAKQWEILIDPNGALIGKFFLRWRERETMGTHLIEEYKGEVGDAFDYIICLEANKKEASTCKPIEESDE